MENEYREKHRKNYLTMRMIYDLTMGILILGMAIVLFFGEQWIQRIGELDPLYRYLFGGACILYGGFRLYRGIKRDY